jgi:hypothetical protein
MFVSPGADQTGDDMTPQEYIVGAIRSLEAATAEATLTYMRAPLADSPTEHLAEVIELLQPIITELQRLATLA